MKKIYKLVLKAFINPFLVTFCIVMFILLMFFLWKWIDDLMGKGLEWYSIAELMVYAAATNVSMALPLAVLLSSIMTFGTLGENYELIAIKAAGISLRKAMFPLFIAIIMLACASFVFSDFMLPIANLKFNSLMYDVRNKKLSFLVKEGVFNNSIDNYAIRVERKSPDGNTLYDVTIYDHTQNTGIPRIIKAKKGQMYKTADGQYLIFRLYDGVRYEESRANNGYNLRQQFTRMRFKETQVNFDLSSFGLKRTNEADFMHNNQMKSMRGLIRKKDSLSTIIDSVNLLSARSLISPYTQAPPPRAASLHITPPKLNPDVLSALPPGANVDNILNSTINAIRQDKEMYQARDSERQSYKGDYIGASVELQRKFTLAASCILLFFIGAPLGAIVRKGGLGLPVVMAVVCFLVYHVLSSVAEKSAKSGSLNPNTAMWMAIIILSPIAAFLTYKASIDSAVFNIDIYTQFFKRMFGHIALFFKKKPKKLTG